MVAYAASGNENTQIITVSFIQTNSNVHIFLVHQGETVTLYLSILSIRGGSVPALVKRTRRPPLSLSDGTNKTAG